MNCEFIETNEPVIKLHKKFGFKDEGFRRENIEKNGKRIGVHYLGLTRSDWLLNKQMIFEKYKLVIAKFNINFENSEILKIIN